AGCEVIMLVGEQLNPAELAINRIKPFEAGALDGAVLEGRHGSDALESLRGELLAIGRRHRHASFAVELVDERVEEQSHGASAVPTPLPSRCRQLPRRRRETSGVPTRISPPPGRNAGGHGISWVIMGVNGKAQ